jgi:hypothetical protein
MKAFDTMIGKTWLPAVLAVSMVCMISSMRAESAEPEKINPSQQAGGAGGISKELPTFDQADKNGDHYVTKDELKDYPKLLESFDQVDAGKDGKLEAHEYGNLFMEEKREDAGSSMPR